MKCLHFFLSTSQLTPLTTTCQTLTYSLDPLKNVVVSKRRAYERDLEAREEGE